MQFAAFLVPLLLLQAGGKLQKVEVAPGKGTPAKVGDLVTVHYTGKLTNGKQFDSSVGSKPFQFVLGAGEVIKGWDQGVAGMKAGGKRKLTIPSDLGYGSQGAGPDIPPNATLVFDVEVVKIDRVDVKVLQQGKGRAVVGGDPVEVHYTGKLSDGTKFDSSLDRGQPFSVTVGQSRVIKGFTMGLLGMKVGERRRVTIPAELAYGDREVGPIPANSKLIFELELVSVGGKKQ